MIQMFETLPDYPQRGPLSECGWSRQRLRNGR